MQAAFVTFAGVTLVGCSDSSRFGDGPAYGTANQQAILGSPYQGGPTTTGSIQPRQESEPWYGRPWQSPRATPPAPQPYPQQSYNTGYQPPVYQQPAYQPRPAYQLHQGPAPVNTQPLQPLARQPEPVAPRVASAPAMQPMPAPVVEPQRAVAPRPAAVPPLTTGSANIRPEPAREPQKMPPAVMREPADPAHRLASNWSAAGGSYVTLREGETVGSIAKRYGVPVSAIMNVNNFADATRVRPGQQVLIPTFNQRAAEEARPAVAVAPAATPAQMRPQTMQLAGAHIVKHGESIDSIAKLYGVSPARLREANGLHGNVMLKPNERVLIPAVPGRHVAENGTPTQQVATLAPLGAESAEAHAATPVAQMKPAQKLAAVAPSLAPAAATGNVLALAAEPKPSVDNPRTVDSAANKQLSFRWPVRGRIIEGFGATVGNTRNDGINLAVPEGTSVKAAEDGEVIYSGNELKGYGNVVLVKHPDGFVSVYAHASDLLVNKGDKVTRGQIIARAGATGNVTQPQLHFELRKGQKPVDPKGYLTN